MNSTVPPQSSAADMAKMVVAIAILLGAVFGYHYFSDGSQLYRVLGIVGAVIVSLLVASQTVIGQAGIRFMIDARMETRKVVWPTKQETTQVTMIIIFIVILVGLILWGLDGFLGWVVKGLIGT